MPVGLELSRPRGTPQPHKLPYKRRSKATPNNSRSFILSFWYICYNAQPSFGYRHADMRREMLVLIASLRFGHILCVSRLLNCAYRFDAPRIVTVCWWPVGRRDRDFQMILVNLPIGPQRCSNTKRMFIRFNKNEAISICSHHARNWWKLTFYFIFLLRFSWVPKSKSLTCTYIAGSTTILIYILRGHNFRTFFSFFLNPFSTNITFSTSFCCVTFVICDGHEME